MNVQVFDGILVLALYAGGTCAILAAGAFLADYVIPRIRPIRRWLEKISNGK